MMSNSTWEGENPANGAICRVARGEEIERGLAMILASSGKAPTQTQLREFIDYTAQRHIDLKAMWVVESGGQMVWSALPMCSPGRTLLLFAPPFTFGGYRSAAADLIDCVCAHYTSRDVHLAQVLLDPPDALSRTFYAELKFREIAELIYLQMQLPKSVKPPELMPGAQWVRYSPQTHRLFAEAILQTYRDSLDCPALSGLRDIEDIIAGHKATGEFDPDRWFLLRQGDQVLGVLLLAAISPGDALELVYVGLLPEARGRGVGTLMIRQAQWCTANVDRRRLTLAVDATNSPALRLYYRHGMQRVGARLAMIRDLRVHP
jgi:mycothiol synthase